ncbi:MULTISPECIES: hypothetical protein [unclassified Clostridioides]|uniref:hypothetical protein n=1 Tax=unclassified Clostridioides TaxID=2635829 RepID=UPI001D11FA27|nr:hypothetical protein [Clostridioides sp. ES-S-0049-03]MCC0678447.1 hypothetical protein [Clostridioides sp. ES-W-0018-02]MCC0713359.1 hypothetical protein [Clostridioides sp. ES-W-0017-02]
MFKRILLILMIGVLGFGVVGCSDDLSEKELAKCEKEWNALEKITDEIGSEWYEEIFHDIYYENDNIEFEGNINNSRAVKITFDEEALNKAKETLKEKRKIVNDINIKRLNKYIKYKIKTDDYYKSLSKEEVDKGFEMLSNSKKFLNKGLDIYGDILDKGEKLEYNEEEIKEMKDSNSKVSDLVHENVL